jgi:hypothetical protein
MIDAGHSKITNIERWWQGLTLDAQIDHVIRAGRCRWIKASAFDLRRNAAVFRKHCLPSRQEALRKLARANLIKAQLRAMRESLWLDLSSRPRLI